MFFRVLTWFQFLLVVLFAWKQIRIKCLWIMKFSCVRIERLWCMVLFLIKLVTIADKFWLWLVLHQKKDHLHWNIHSELRQRSRSLSSFNTFISTLYLLNHQQLATIRVLISIIQINDYSFFLSRLKSIQYAWDKFPMHKFIRCQVLLPNN